VNVSRILLAIKFDPFEELINYLEGGRLRFILFHLPLFGLVSDQYFVLSFLWFFDKVFKNFI
jgi:hypothetical protein